MGRNSYFVTSYSYVDYLRTLQTTEEIYRSNLGKPTLHFILISVDYFLRHFEREPGGILLSKSVTPAGLTFL